MTEEDKDRPQWAIVHCHRRPFAKMQGGDDTMTVVMAAAD